MTNVTNSLFIKVKGTCTTTDYRILLPIPCKLLNLAIELTTDLRYLTPPGACSYPNTPWAWPP